MTRAILCICFASFAAQAQPLRVFSEFARMGADGEPAVPQNPREILSPAVARNAFATFQVLVKAPAGATLWVGQNPENAFQVTLYREESGKLRKVNEPVEVKGSEVIWMDVFVPKDAPLIRIKLEPELFIDKDWVIYPMEVRVEGPTLDEPPRGAGSAAPFEVMRSFLCGTKPVPGPDPGLTRAGLSFRNAQGDLKLAEKASKLEMQKIFGACNQPAPSNPEAYLRIRDYLLRLR
jgi:hypothetical protein